jgi:glutamate carboxypeptidase
MNERLYWSFAFQGSTSSCADSSSQFLPMTNDSPHPVPPLLEWLHQRQPEMVRTLQRLLELESPSNAKTAVDRLGTFLADRFEELGGTTTLHRQAKFGDQLQVDFPGAFNTRPILLLGHLDTVWDLNTLAAMPIRMEAGRLYGPGVFDMKGGIAIGMYAIAALRELRGALPRPITVLLNPDEEVGSDVSRPVTEALARESKAVLVLEPAQGPHGAVKTARKGVGDYSLKVSGVAAHAGLDFDKGESAVLELARQIQRVSEFTDLARGLTVNVGVIRGGTRGNVIAAEASAEVDVRIAHIEDAAGVEERFRSLAPFNPKCKLEVSGGINRPPMERNEGVARLYGLAREVASSLGIDLAEASVGGGSDGNFTSVLAPTLDGLGAVGEGAHAKNENIVLAELPRRAALLAGLIEAI